MEHPVLHCIFSWIVGFGKERLWNTSMRSPSSLYLPAPFFFCNMALQPTQNIVHVEVSKSIDNYGQTCRCPWLQVLFDLLYCQEEASFCSFAGWKMSLLLHLFQRISILGEWMVIHHQSFGDICLLTLQEFKKRNFGPLECVHLLQECASHSLQVDILTKGNLPWSPFSRSIWICLEILPVSSIWYGSI